MTCRAARQLIFLQQHHVLPSRLRELIDDAGAGDATTDHDRARAIHLFAEPYSGRGCCFVSGSRKSSRAPATAATPPSSIAPPSPAEPATSPTACRPAMLPPAPARG